MQRYVKKWTDPFLHQPRHDFICKGRIIRTSSGPRLNALVTNTTTANKGVGAHEEYKVRDVDYMMPQDYN